MVDPESKIACERVAWDDLYNTVEKFVNRQKINVF